MQASAASPYGSRRSSGMFTNPDVRSRPPKPRMMRPTAMLDRTMSASTSDDKRRIGAEPPNRALGGRSAVKGPAADERDRAAKEEVAQRQRLIEQQPEDEQAGRHEREGQEPRHVPPALRACCSAPAAGRRGRSPGARAATAAVACMKRMTGPAWIVCIAQRIRSSGDRRHLDHPHARHGAVGRRPEGADARAGHGDERRQSGQDQDDEQGP